LIIGKRIRENIPPGRKFISLVAHSAVALLFGRGINDVNCSFRLLKNDSFRELLRTLPDDSLVPNILLSAWAVKHKLPTIEIPVPYYFEKTRKSTLRRSLLPKFAIRAFFQVLRFRLSGD
jgi:hypothetical protein